MAENINTNEEDLNDDELTAFIDSLCNQVSKDETGVSIARINKVKMVELLYKNVKKIIKKNGATTTCHLHEPFSTTGYVSIVGRKIIINNPRMFTAISRRFENIEVYPKVDSTVEINLTTHGLTQKIGE